MVADYPAFGALGTGQFGRRRKDLGAELDQRFHPSDVRGLVVNSDLKHRSVAAALICGLLLTQRSADAAPEQREHGSAPALRIVEEATPFLPGIASTSFSEIRLTLSPDGRTALWFS